MHEQLLLAASKLTTDALFERINALALQERSATVELVAHLAELIGRRTDLGEGWGAVYEHCRSHLHLSEDAAYNRVAAARAVRRFPVILDHLAEGWVSVTTVKVLAPVLTQENHVALLKETRHRRRSEVEIIVARVAPRAEKPGSVHKLPARKPLPAPAVDPPAAPIGPVSSTGGAPAETPEPPRPAAFRPPVKPVAPARFRIDVTVGQEGHDALRLLQDLLAREFPGGDVSKVVEHCLIATAAEVRREMTAATRSPRAPRPSKEGSRAIAARVRRTVWKRDGGRCAFVGPHGRCTQTRYLELHHIHPFALGGPSTVENIALRCRAHNVYEGERDFGVRTKHVPVACAEKERVSGQIAPSQDGGAHVAGAQAP
jgi:5-methylcytosine-specific restriction endonuclease McrA